MSKENPSKLHKFFSAVCEMLKLQISQNFVSSPFECHYQNRPRNRRNLKLQNKKFNLVQLVCLNGWMDGWMDN